MRKTTYRFNESIKLARGNASLWLFFWVSLLALLVSCKEDPQPKPAGFLALEYPEPRYELTNLPCPFQFEKNTQAIVVPAKGKQPCWFNLDYPQMRGTIFLTYQQIRGNLDSLLRDAQRLPLQHTIKADGIEGDLYTNEYMHTYGMFYEVSGNAASQAQFYVTDSLRHFLTGSVYFEVEPNFDSILPAAHYLKQDMRYLMESLRWQ